MFSDHLVVDSILFNIVDNIEKFLQQNVLPSFSDFFGREQVVRFLRVYTKFSGVVLFSANMAKAGIKVEPSPTNRMFLMISNAQQNILYQINIPPLNGKLKLHSWRVD